MLLNIVWHYEHFLVTLKRCNGQYDDYKYFEKLIRVKEREREKKN